VPGAAEIVVDWCAELAECHGWGRSDPLFPQNHMGLDENGGFIAVGLARKGWATSEPVRAIFKRAFAAAGINYHNPHSLRADGNEPDPREDGRRKSTLKCGIPPAGHFA
jgi:hypothetical protein